MILWQWGESREEAQAKLQRQPSIKQSYTMSHLHVALPFSPALPLLPHTPPNQALQYSFMLTFSWLKGHYGQVAADAKHRGGEALLRAWISAPEQPISLQQKVFKSKKVTLTYGYRFKRSIALALEACEVQSKLYFVLKSMGSTPRGPKECTPEVDVIRNSDITYQELHTSL